MGATDSTLRATTLGEPFPSTVLTENDLWTEIVPGAA